MSLSSRRRDLLGPVTRVQKKKTTHLRKVLDNGASEGPSRICNESSEHEEEEATFIYIYIYIYIYIDVKAGTRNPIITLVLGSHLHCFYATGVVKRASNALMIYIYIYTPS